MINNSKPFSSRLIIDRIFFLTIIHAISMQTKRTFVIRNQFQQYLDKHAGWQSGKDAQALYRADYHDQALNTLIEINARDISLRGEIIETDLDDKKRPIVEISEAALALDSDLASMEAKQPSDLALAGVNPTAHKERESEVAEDENEETSHF